MDLIRDLKHTLRRLGRTPAFTLAIILTLALGIGANTAIFSVINTVLLKALPFPEPDRLVAVMQTAPGVNIKDLNACLADYVTYREESKTFAEIALWNSRSASVTEFSQAERVEGIGVTYRLLPMLGVHPVLGRDFTEKDNLLSSPEVIMLGYGYWQRRFSSDPKIVGRRIMIEGTAREVIGVLPKSFWFLDQAQDLVFPFRYDRAAVHLAGYNYQAIARLRPGVTLTLANADVERMIAIELGRFPPPTGMSTNMLREARLAPNLRLLKDEFLGDIGKSLWVITATIGMLLLIACANVANLLLVRADGRAQELAVRAALGAGRGRLARDLYLESLVLSLSGGVLAVVLSSLALKSVLAINPARLPRIDQISVDATAMLFTLVLSIVSGIAFGTLPVLRYGGAALAPTLRAGGRTASSSRGRNVARNALTVVQVALALVLLIGSGLMIRTFQSMRRVHPGFQHPEALQTLRISVPSTATQKDADLALLHQHLVDRLSSIPGVSTVSLIGALPMTGARNQDPVFASDHSYAARQLPPLRRFIMAAPRTFEALGASLAAGREFTWTEILEQRRVVIIGENFAREYWGSAATAIGKQIRSNPADPWSEVIGVASDIRHDGSDKPAPSTVYWPMRAPGSARYLIRGPRAGIESFTSEIRRAVASVNPNLPITDMQTMLEVYRKSMSRTAFTLTLLAISSGMALLLAAIGIYALISYTVAQRRREIGIRMALGARHATLKLMFLRNGLLLSSLGAAAGLAAAAALSRLMSALLYEVNPLDPLTYAAVAACLLVVATVASYLPARRIMQVDPIEALRAE